MNDTFIRDARREDVATLLEIYRPFVTDTAVSFEVDPPDEAEFSERIAKAQSLWAWLVAESGGRVVGYAYGSAFRTRAAYRLTAEVSAYVSQDHRGKGVARLLYKELLDRLAGLGYCNAYAGIALPNDASVGFHKSMGFTPVGVFHRAGYKFNRWHDVSWWETKLRDAPPA